MDTARVTATFEMLREHKTTWNLIGQPTFHGREVVEYVFDGYMDCLLIEEDGVIIDVQDFSMEMLAEGCDYKGRRKFDTIEAWAEKFIQDMATPPM